MDKNDDNTQQSITNRKHVFGDALQRASLKPLSPDLQQPKDHVANPFADMRVLVFRKERESLQHLLLVSIHRITRPGDDMVNCPNGDPAHFGVWMPKFLQEARQQSIHWSTGSLVDELPVAIFREFGQGVQGTQHGSVGLMVLNARFYLCEFH